jgi:polyisoprenoid-binding protein YceI
MRCLVLAVILGGAMFAQAAEKPDDVFVADPKQSSASYHLVHKLHKVTGVSHQLDARARILPNGQAQVMLRVPSQSFDSGNVNRDEHMKETVEAARYPNIEIKGYTEELPLPSAFPATVEKRFHVQVSFHGVQQQKEVPVRVVFESATRLRAACHFTISLDSFKVERPSLLFVKVNDELDLDTDLMFNRI